MKKHVKLVTFVTSLSFLFAYSTFSPDLDTAAYEGHMLYPETSEMLESNKERLELEKIEAEEALREAHDKEEEANKFLAKKSLDELAEKNAGPKMTLVGSYQLTAYIATGSPCASGVYPTVNHTVACNSLPLGTRIYIEGYGEYVVEDTGGMGGGVIDVFVGSYGEAISFGRRSANVYIIEED